MTHGQRYSAVTDNTFAQADGINRLYAEMERDLAALGEETRLLLGNGKDGEEE